MQIDPVTFAFELINFLVLAFLLQRLVYRPVAASIAERRKEITETRAAAAEKLALVDKRAEELATRDRELDALRETIFAEATAAAATERAKLIAEARADADAERKRVQAMLAAEREAALGWVREVTVEKGVEVAGRMLLELVPDAAHDALVRRLFDVLAAHPELREQARPDETVHVDATFARMPTKEQSQALKQLLEASVGSTVRVTITEDERLGAGATVRVRDRVFDASVAGQLEILRDDARHQLAREHA
ncbi:MAG: F0F1 ATP synthase subunit delta [Alphaproteobacteria bacterium]|nr:F0F1 ATP synthase subunit delta [Alphaproteobacteria bacterium]